MVCVFPRRGLQVSVSASRPLPLACDVACGLPPWDAPPLGSPPQVGRAGLRLPPSMVVPEATGAGPEEPLAHAETNSPQANTSPVPQLVAWLARRFCMAPLLTPAMFLGPKSYAEPKAAHSVGPEGRASPRPPRGIGLTRFCAESRISIALRGHVGPAPQRARP